MAGHARYCGGCGSAIAPTSSAQYTAQVPEIEMLGQDIVGRYRISAKLGEGGMGAVYRAQQISLKRTIALKVLRPELSANKGLVRRFNAEAELAAKLNHPNTVTLYDFGQDEQGILFIAMEFIEGCSLRDTIVREGPLALPRLIKISSQICSSLADAHRAGIIHRDLKPDNVMLSEVGRKRDQVTVLDFGIAKLRDIKGDITQQPMTQVGDMLGTPQYMAPEQIRGTNVDARTDIYALGVMLYEMATARLPFDGNTMMALLSKHLTETPVAPIARRPELAIHPALSALIMRCLEKEPNLRPSTMEDLEDLLQAIPAENPSQRISSEASSHAPTSLVAGLHQQAGQASGMGQQVAGQAPGMEYQATGLVPGMGHQTPRNPTTGPGTQTPPNPIRGQSAGVANETLNVGQASSAKSSAYVWAIPLVLILLAAGGGGVYYTHFRSASSESKAETPKSHTAQGPMDTEFKYTDIAFGYKFDVPTGFKGEGNSSGDASFVGEVYGVMQHIVLKAWKGNSYAAEADIFASTKEYVSTELKFSITPPIWEDIDGLRVLHGRGTKAANSDAEYMLTHIGETYYFVIVSGPVSSNPEIARFRNDIFRKRIRLRD